ncbi:MAG: signal recognition particle subunit SRP19/SEC65 family protein [Candidatus Thermoplasmatota archaeon]
MVSKADHKIVLWPMYFDKALSRKNGRRLPRKYCVEKPTCEALVKAAQSLGLHPVFEKNAAHPRTSYKKDGRILVDKKDSKQKVFIQIFNRL